MRTQVKHDFLAELLGDVALGIPGTRGCHDLSRAPSRTLRSGGAAFCRVVDSAPEKSVKIGHCGEKSPSRTIGAARRRPTKAARPKTEK